MNREIDNHLGASDWTLAQLVRDPLIGLLMQSDGVDRRSIELLFERLARDRAGATQQCAVVAGGR